MFVWTHNFTLVLYYTYLIRMHKLLIPEHTQEIPLLESNAQGKKGLIVKLKHLPLPISFTARAVVCMCVLFCFSLSLSLVLHHSTGLAALTSACIHLPWVLSTDNITASCKMYVACKWSECVLVHMVVNMEHKTKNEK